MFIDVFDPLRTDPMIKAPPYTPQTLSPDAEFTPISDTTDLPEIVVTPDPPPGEGWEQVPGDQFEQIFQPLTQPIDIIVPDDLSELIELGARI